MPPEAAAAAAAAAASPAGAGARAWACGVCTCINAPGAARCEACGAREGAGGGGEAFPSLPSSSSSAGGGGKKGGKQSLQDFLTAGRVHPQNVWSQKRPDSAAGSGSSKGSGGPSQPASAGQWGARNGGGAKLAKSIGAVNDAWGQ